MSLILLLLLAQDLEKPIATWPEHRAKIREGIALHDRGEFAAAAARYGEVLAENPADIVALFELSYSQYAKKDYAACITTCRRGLRHDSGQRAGFFMNLGSCLDGAGRAQEAVEVYRQGLAAFPNEALLYFNLGVTQRGLDDPEGARQSFQQALQRDPRHSSSHLYLADTYARTGYRIPALLAASYFLVLEPDSRRSPGVVKIIFDLIEGSVTRNGKDVQVHLNLAAPKDEGDFSPAELALMIAAAARTPEKGTKRTPRESLLSAYRVIAEVAGRTDGKPSGFAAEFYLPFLRELAGDHLEAFAARLLLSRDGEARQWAEKNAVAMKALAEWSATRAAGH